jgi:hypothetical protein
MTTALEMEQELQYVLVYLVHKVPGGNSGPDALEIKESPGVLVPRGIGSS